MKKNAMLNVKGLRRAEGEDDEVVDFITEAEFFVEDDFYAVEYKESELTGMDGTLTRIEFKESGVSIIRTGTNPSHLVFEPGKRHVTMYDTGVGMLEIAVRSDFVDSNLSENGGVAEFNYYIEINGQEASYNEFEMKVTEAVRKDECYESYSEC